MSDIVKVDLSQMRGYFAKLGAAGNGAFKKELRKYLEQLGKEFLRVVEDEIIKREVFDSSTLAQSLQPGDKDGIWELNEGNLTLEVGTKVEYASFVNDGHWTCKAGEKSRFIPGDWDENGKFYHIKGSDTGMVLKQKWVKGKPYWDSALRIFERMLPGLVDAKIQLWFNEYFL